MFARMVLLLLALCVIGGVLGEQSDKTTTVRPINYPYQYSNYPYNYPSNYPYNYPSNYPYSNSPYNPNYPYSNYPYNPNHPYGNYPYNPKYSYNNNYPYAGYQNGYPYNNNRAYYDRYYNGVGPSSYYNQARILRYNNNNDGTGNYQFEYETENGIRQQEVGQLKQIDSPDPTTVVQGSYSYVAPNGQTYSVNYVADENGFQPSGNHIPLQKSYPNNPYAAYRKYYNYPQYGEPTTNDGKQY